VRRQASGQGTPGLWEELYFRWTRPGGSVKLRRVCAPGRTRRSPGCRALGCDVASGVGSHHFSVQKVHGVSASSEWRAARSGNFSSGAQGLACVGFGSLFFRLAQLPAKSTILPTGWIILFFFCSTFFLFIPLILKFLFSWTRASSTATR